MLLWVRFDLSTWISTSVFIYNSLSAFKIKNYCAIHPLMLVLPHWDAFQAEKPILTLGTVLTPQITWMLQSSTRPWNPRDAPRAIPVCTQQQTTAPFIPTSFQGLPAWHLPSCVWWSSQQLGEAVLPPSKGVTSSCEGLGQLRRNSKGWERPGHLVRARDSEGLYKFALGCNIFLLTLSELHNGEVKDMPVSLGRNWGSDTKPFALEDIIPTTLDRMETNNKGCN